MADVLQVGASLSVRNHGPNATKVFEGRELAERDG